MLRLPLWPSPFSGHSVPGNMIRAYGDASVVQSESAPTVPAPVSLGDTQPNVPEDVWLANPLENNGENDPTRFWGSDQPNAEMTASMYRERNSLVCPFPELDEPVSPLGPSSGSVHDGPLVPSLRLPLRGTRFAAPPPPPPPFPPPSLPPPSARPPPPPNTRCSTLSSPPPPSSRPTSPTPNSSALRGLPSSRTARIHGWAGAKKARASWGMWLSRRWRRFRQSGWGGG